VGQELSRRLEEYSCSAKNCYFMGKISISIVLPPPELVAVFKFVAVILIDMKK